MQGCSHQRPPAGGCRAGLQQSRRRPGGRGPTQAGEPPAAGPARPCRRRGLCPSSMSAKQHATSCRLVYPEVGPARVGPARDQWPCRAQDVAESAHLTEVGGRGREWMRGRGRGEREDERRAKNLAFRCMHGPQGARACARPDMPCTH